MSVIRDIANQAEYGEAQSTKLAMTPGTGLSRPSTLTENLEYKKADLEAKLETVNKAIAALKENPKFEEMINLLARV